MAEETKVPLLSRLRAPRGAVKAEKRLGRGPGSGLGTTAGKGQKGQRARSGGQVARWFEGGQTPLIRRLPKIGFHNPFSRDVVVVNIGSLAGFDAGTVVDPQALAQAGLVKGRFEALKVLGNGTLEKALTVRAHAFSESAKAAIEKAGGKAELIDPPPAETPVAETPAAG
jgi:large subunit ribosomal protein L15